MAARKKKRSSGASSGVLSHLGLAVGLGGAGLVVAFALTWWQAIVQPQAAMRAAERDAQLGQYTQLFNARIVELKDIVHALATSPEVVSVMGGYDVERRDALAAQLSNQHPSIARVALIEKGGAEVDLNAEVPISFAALDLIRRAETQSYVGPEVSLNQRNLIYAAQPVTPQGVVAGVVLVVFDAQFFLTPLAQYEDSAGVLEIHQKFAGTPSTVVMQWGRNAGSAPAVDAQLFAGHWTLSFVASDDTAAAVGGGITQLLVPLAVALLAVVGGIFVALSRFSRKVEEDTATLTDQVARVLRGRAPGAASFSLSPLEKASQTLAPTQPGGARDEDKEEEQADTSDDLLEGLDEEATNKDSDDFLEVRSSAVPDDNFGIEVSEEVGPMEMGVDLDAGIFRAYDIRGITTSNLTEDVVYWIGRAFAAEAQAQESDPRGGGQGRAPLPATSAEQL